MVPLQPAWSLVYLSLYFSCFVPLVVMRQEEQIRRTVLAYLLVWITAYACFLLYPTVLPRPPRQVIGEGFSAWILQLIYPCDAPPYNCFPCLHVAQPVVAALTCYRVSRGVGLAAGVWAALIAVSTLFTKQHYVVDVIAGVALGGAAFPLFFRGYPLSAIPQLDRRVAPLVVLGFIAIHALLIAGFWVAYQLR